MSGSAAENKETVAEDPAARQACALCGQRLWRKRRDSRFCSAAHRAEASRYRRLLAGESVDECESLAEYLTRRQRRTRRSWEPQQEITERNA